MNSYARQILDGQAAGNVPLSLPADARIHLTGQGGVLGLDDRLLRCSVLALGASRSGKTTVLLRMLAQLRDQMGEDDFVVVLDSRGEFKSLFRPGDVVLHPGHSDAGWNIFAEVLADGDDPPLIARNAAMLAKRLIRENHHQPFFSTAPQRVLECFLESYATLGLRRPEQRGSLDTAFLVDWFRHAGPEAYEAFRKALPNSGELASYLGGSADNLQALGVKGELHAALAQLLPFAAHGEFSIRQFVRARGHALFIDYDPAAGGAYDEICALFLDLAIMETLSAAPGHGRVYFFLDELSRLGRQPEYLEALLNFGAGQALGGVLAGVQSVAQLTHLYGREHALSVLAGFQTYIAFRPADADTVQAIQARAGTVTVAERFLTAGKVETAIREICAIPDRDLLRLPVGRAAVLLPGEVPFYFTFTQ